MFEPGTPVAVFNTWVVRGPGEPAIAVIYKTSELDYKYFHFPPSLMKSQLVVNYLKTEHLNRPKKNNILKQYIK